MFIWDFVVAMLVAVILVAFFVLLLGARRPTDIASLILFFGIILLAA